MKIEGDDGDRSGVRRSISIRVDADAVLQAWRDPAVQQMLLAPRVRQVAAAQGSSEPCRSNAVVDARLGDVEARAGRLHARGVVPG